MTDNSRKQMTNPGNTLEQRLTALEERLHEMDDVVAQRCLAILDVVDELHRQVTEQISQNAQAIAQLTANAEADRVEIRRIWEYLLSQHPNGKGEQA